MPAHAARPRYRMSSGWRDAAALGGFLVVSYAAGALGSFTMGDFAPWYDALAKPTWTPPGSLIGAVWSVLYAVIGVAAWLVWRARSGSRMPLVLWGVQLGLNAAWSGIFFGLHLIGLALAEIILLWLVVAATAVAFWRVRRSAGLLMLPYLAWVTFAGVLNAVIFTMN